MRTKGRAFTLVELLVVIGIIAVLMSILLPVLNVARRQANIVACSSNIRQIAMAAITFAQEHGNYMPLAGDLQATPGPSYGVNTFAVALNDPSRRRYAYALNTGMGPAYVVLPLPAALAPYMGIKDLPTDDWAKVDQAMNENRFRRRFMCPATDSINAARASSDPSDASLVGQAMMMSLVQGAAQMDWATNSDYGFNEGALGYHYDGHYDSRRLRGNVSKMRRPNQLALITDAKPRSQPANAAINLPWILWTPSLTSHNEVTLADALAGNGKAVDADMFDKQRHKDRINVGFADGHVETKLISEKDLDRVYLLPP
jgi:prepilin-type processing-associated H-X9-DG protein/prepilin-type N-terminal cleavage/methylation domain-containing protein